MANNHLLISASFAYISAAWAEVTALRTTGRITHLIDTHDWTFSWDPRGIRLCHEAHTFVLGLPAIFREYLEDTPRA